MKKRIKEISKDQRLQLIGLMTLVSQAYQKMNEVDKAMQSIVGSKNSYDMAGPLSEEYFEDNPNVDECLKQMKIKVVKKK